MNSKYDINRDLAFSKYWWWRSERTW